MKKRKLKTRQKEIIADRKAGRIIVAPQKEDDSAKTEQSVSDEQTIDEISERLDESIEIGDMSEPDISDIAEVINSEENNDKSERTENDE